MPAPCPPYGSCGSALCRCHGCSCLNPWAAHGGPVCHRKCSSRPAEGPALEEGGAACRVGGVRHAAGDLAFFVPPSEDLDSGRALDIELELVRPADAQGHCNQARLRSACQRRLQPTGLQAGQRSRSSLCPPAAGPHPVAAAGRG